MNFATIGNQVQFIDTIKYFQQNLGGLASRLTSSEKIETRRQCHSFLLSQPTLYIKFMKLSQEDQDWVLEYLSTGKRAIPYQMITDFDSLSISPEKEFFSQHLFHSTLKDSQISIEDYKNVKRFYTLMKYGNLGELNRIYNFQGTIILCEIFEQRSVLLKQIFKYNPKKCNSASSFSSFVQRNKSKFSIALPTDAEFVRVFEKTLIGGFSCINTRLAFDTDILIKNPESEKVLVEIENNEGQKQLKILSSKIIKMDENNQYGQALTKPLPYGCIKNKKRLLHLIT